MTGTAATADERGRIGRSRQPKQLLLAFFGEYVVDQDVPPLRASALIEVLEGAGVAAPSTRATLDRMVRRTLLAKKRRGREIAFSLTDEGAAVLREATERVRGQHPFEPHGSGWTLVTFTIPEHQRTLRHRLRSALIWEGFAPLRDGLWLAPGEVDLASALEPLRASLPPGAVTAFHARELPGYAMGENVRTAWNLDAIRGEHLAFIAEWGGASLENGGSALSTRTMLVADWLALLRADPRLPRHLVDAAWPAERSFEVYWARRRALESAARAEFDALAATSAVNRRSVSAFPR